MYNCVSVEHRAEVPAPHPPTLPVSTAPAVCVLCPRTQSSHPGRHRKVALVQSLETPCAGFPAAQEVEKG